MADSVAVIICASGASSRFGKKKKKPFVNVAGKAAFLHSVEVFEGIEAVKQILLAIPADEEEMVGVKWGPNLKFFGVKVFVGGKERFETVQKGLELVRDDIDLIAVHDAVRCCVRKEWVEECLEKASETGAAILACPVVATIKKVEDGKIIETVDRSNLYEAQTPQVFSAKVLKEAYSKLGELDSEKISDDAQLVEAIGKEVSIVETDSSNVKLTRPTDTAIAEAIIKSRSKAGAKGPAGPYAEAQW